MQPGIQSEMDLTEPAEIHDWNECKKLWSWGGENPMNYQYHIAGMILCFLFLKFHSFQLSVANQCIFQILGVQQHFTDWPLPLPTATSTGGSAL